MPKNFNKNRILKNSLLLYLRMLFTMWLNLYATRLVLNNLGVEDMGVYGVVGSIVGMFTIFTSGITSAVQRFLTYELGSQKGNMNNVFCSSLNVIFIYNPQNEMFRLLGTKRSFSQNETFFFSHP